MATPAGPRIFQIERTGPPGGGPARYILVVHIPGSIRQAARVHQRSWLYNQPRIELRSLLRRVFHHWHIRVSNLKLESRWQDLKYLGWNS